MSTPMLVSLTIPFPLWMLQLLLLFFVVVIVAAVEAIQHESGTVSGAA